MLNTKDIVTFINIFAENTVVDLINSIERNDFIDTTALLTTVEADVKILTNIIKVELTVAGYAKFLVNGITKTVPRKRRRPQLRAKRISSKAYSQPIDLAKYNQSIVSKAIETNLKQFYENIGGLDKDIQKKINEEIKDYNFKIKI